MDLGIFFVQVMSVNANRCTYAAGFCNLPDPVHNFGLQREMMVLELDEKMIFVKQRLHLIKVGV